MGLKKLSSRLAVLLPAAGLAAALAAGPAVAQEPKTSDNVKFLKNVAFPLRYESKDARGSDHEFATLTLPGTGGATPATAPVAPPAKPAAKAKKRSAHARCVAKAKKQKSKSKRSKALKKCKKLKKKSKSKKAKRSSIDVRPRAAGVQKTFAFMGSYNNGLQIMDVSDPRNPELFFSYDCGIAQGDVQIFTRDDFPGRTFVAFASDDGYAFQADSKCFKEAAALGFDAEGKDGDGTFIIDVTDPGNPFTVAFIHFERGSHNQTVHPSGKYLYNSNSDLITNTSPGIEVVDISDLKAPKEIAKIATRIMPGLGNDSHDISFSPDGTRAYSAAVAQTLVIDTTDPAKPRLISSIYDPAVNVSHQAEVIEVPVPGLGTRKVLLVADEFGGATDTGQCPNGGLHVYDVTGPAENAPQKVGYFNITAAGLTDGESDDVCTAHVYQLHRDTGLMTIAWYNQGFRVLDIKEAVGIAFGGRGLGIKELASGRRTGGSLWAAKSVPGKTTRSGEFTVYGNDQVRGLDAYAVTLSAAAARRAPRLGQFYRPGNEPQLRAGSTRGLAFKCLLDAQDQ